MASALPIPPITIEQYSTFESPEGFRDELINGRIVMSPEPKVLHFDVADNLYQLLTKAAGKKFRVGQRINLRFPEANSMPSPDVFVIDLAEWKRARNEDVYPDGSQVLLAVEVLSPSNRKPALQSKIDIYTSHGIEAWLVDPKRQEVKVYSGSKVRAASQTNKSVLVWNGKPVLLSAIFRLPG
jgi:Uma2 family endonuclease